MSNQSLRFRARVRLVQSLYQHLATKDDAAILCQQMTHANSRFDHAYFKELLFCVIDHKTQLTEKFMEFSDHPIKLIPPVDQCILLLGSAELIHRIDIPNHVVVDQAVELAKHFGSTKSYGFINATLDKLLSQLIHEEKRYPKSRAS